MSTYVVLDVVDDASGQTVHHKVVSNGTVARRWVERNVGPGRTATMMHPSGNTTTYKVGEGWSSS